MSRLQPNLNASCHILRTVLSRSFHRLVLIHIPNRRKGRGKKMTLSLKYLSMAIMTWTVYMCLRLTRTTRVMGSGDSSCDSGVRSA
eukprot:scaffold104714_cov38-Prasinocladus_malaysianus.AAC.1